MQNPLNQGEKKDALRVKRDFHPQGVAQVVVQLELQTCSTPVAFDNGTFFSKRNSRFITSEHDLERATDEFQTRCEQIVNLRPLVFET